MSSSNSTSSMTAVIDLARSLTMFTQVWSVTVFLVGAIGHTLNIYVLTRPTFRANPSARYFLAMTLSGCVVVCITIPVRLLQYGYGIDVFIYSDQSCRILSYLLNCTRVLPSWFVLLVAIDRFLCSSSSLTLRSWSRIRVTTPGIVVTILFILLLYMHMPFNYTILLPQRTCDGTSSTYRGFFALWNLLWWSWIPTIGMLMFGFLTVVHLRQVRKRIVPQNTGNENQRNYKKIDRQLTQMLLLQCLVFVSTTTVMSIASLYVTISNSWRNKPLLEKIQDNYLTGVTNYISLVGPCLSFYLFTLTSPMFRRVLIDLVRRR